MPSPVSSDISKKARPHRSSDWSSTIAERLERQLGCSATTAPALLERVDFAPAFCAPRARGAALVVLVATAASKLTPVTPATGTSVPRRCSARPARYDGRHPPDAITREHNNEVEPTEPGRAQAIRRESELEALERFFGPAFRSRGLVLCGDAGMGKTSMWEMGRSIGAANGYAVLSARASEAETGLSFAALADLVDGIPPKVLAGQPGPQRQALEVAVRRAAPAGPAPEPLAISTGFYRALLGLAQHGPLVVAIDDVQWLDEASARAIVFAAQRLQGPGVRFLLSTRSHRPSEIEKALPPESVGRLELKPLSF